MKAKPPRFRPATRGSSVSSPRCGEVAEWSEVGGGGPNNKHRGATQNLEPETFFGFLVSTGGINGFLSQGGGMLTVWNTRFSPM